MRGADDIVAGVKAATGGHGADVVFDPVGGEAFDASTKCIAFEGRIIVVGFAGGTIPTVAAGHVLVKNYSVVGLHWGMYPRVRPDLVDVARAELTRLTDEGAVRPVVDRVVPFEEAPAALDRPRGGRDRGPRRHPGRAMTDLDGRVAIVTGGARGLGEAYVRALHAAGAARRRRRPPRRDGRARSPASSATARCSPTSTSPTRSTGMPPSRATIERVRRRRRARQQRRHRQCGADRALHPREVERRDRRQPHRRLPRLPRGRAADEGAGRAARSSTSRRSRGCGEARACTATPRRSSACAGSRRGSRSSSGRAASA